MQTICDLIEHYVPKAGFNSATDVQVLCPMTRGVVGIRNLNAVLQQLINPAAEYKEELVRGDSILRTGDRVMQLKNDYNIDNWQKIYYCPLKRNRLVDDTEGKEKYKIIDLLHWSQPDKQQGKSIKIKGFPSAKKVKLFRVTISTNRTEYIATNELTCDSLDEAQNNCSYRWKIEEFHRELKQLTGI